MIFTTGINIKHSDREISYNDHILMLGSCFSENICQKLNEAYFQVNANPFGILYNPISIAECIKTLLTGEHSATNVHHNGLWHSMLHHGCFSCADKEEFKRRINESVVSGRKALEEASVIIVTFGTAWVYEMEGKVVGNCHKLPSECFTRRRLSVDEIADIWREILALPIMQGKHLIFTVSPIRHLKDGLHENQLSKATLLLACEKIAEEIKQTAESPSVDYFPSYEILLDELRDYRFYAEDMLHPSAVAVDYIWQRFADTYFSDATQTEILPLQQLWNDMHHRPLHPDSVEYIRFKEQTEKKARALQKKYPWISLSL